MVWGGGGGGGGGCGGALGVSGGKGLTLHSAGGVQGKLWSATRHPHEPPHEPHTNPHTNPHTIFHTTPHEPQLPHAQGYDEKGEDLAEMLSPTLGRVQRVVAAAAEAVPGIAGGCGHGWAGGGQAPLLGRVVVGRGGRGAGGRRTWDGHTVTA